MEDAWSGDDDDILLSQAADKIEQNVCHDTESDDDLILSQSLEQIETDLPPVSNPQSSVFPESDDDDLILSQSLTETENDLRLQDVANTLPLDRFPESDDDDLILSQSLLETEEQLQADSKLLSNGNLLSRYNATSPKLNLGQGLQNQNEVQSNQRISADMKESVTMMHSQGSPSQLKDPMSHEVIDKDNRNMSHCESKTSVASSVSSSEAVAGPSNDGCHKEVDEELQQKKKSLEQVKNTFDSELQCSICNELFVQATSLNCAHAFCALCIGQWLRTSRACPMCRTTVTSKTRSIVLDNFIDKMCEHLGEGMKEERQALLETREREQARFDANPPAPTYNPFPSSPIPWNIVVSSGTDSSPDRRRYLSPPPYFPGSPSPGYSPTYSDIEFIDNRNSSDFSTSSDSLDSTDSSATDFSDHSPRSRQRRREMRHRERRSRRQHRRNRRTDSDSSMSYGRRVSSRRRRREDRRKGRDRSRRRRDHRGSTTEETTSDSSSDDEDTHRRRWRVERRSDHRRRRDRDTSTEDSFSVTVDEESDEIASRERDRSRRRRLRIESDSGDSVPSRAQDGRRDRDGRRRRHRGRSREGDGSTSAERRRDRRRNPQRILSTDEDNVNTGGSDVADLELPEGRYNHRTRRGSDETGNNGQSSFSRRNSDRTERRSNGRLSRLSGHNHSSSRAANSEGNPDRSGSMRSSRATSYHRSDNATVASTSRGTRLTGSHSSTRSYYGGYGKCFRCGQSGHWANGCPTR